MSLYGRFVLLALIGVFVVWPFYWAATRSEPALRAKAQRVVANGPVGCTVTSKVLRVRVSRSRYPENWRHIVDARNGRNTASDGRTVIDTGLRYPTVLVLNRVGADARRAAAFRVSGLDERAGQARDEYPPAFARTTDTADIRYVDLGANSGQGASMGNQLRSRCNGQPFKLVAAP